METPTTPSNKEITKALETHLPKEENSSLWDTLTQVHGVSNSEPIDLAALWGTLNTWVTADKIEAIWKSINRPVELDIK